MNLRCMYCQTPFTVGRLEKLAALQKMQAENLLHYDAHCPRCRRANSVSHQKLEMFTPGWQEGLKTLEKEAAQVEKEMVGKAQAIETAVSASAEAVEQRPAPKPVTTPKKAAPTEKKPAAKASPAPKAKATAKSKPAASAKKPAVKKTVVKRPATKSKTKK